jgi:predicted nucleic acid-binding protein
LTIKKFFRKKFFGSMDKVFVDTDVILDFIMDREPFADVAVILFSMGDNGKLKLYTSGLVFSNCYYILRKLTTHGKVVEKLKSLASFIDFVPVNKQVVLEALHSSFKDFEDALQNAAAATGGISILVTRNTKDYRTSGLSVMTPEEYLASLT